MNEMSTAELAAIEIKKMLEEEFSPGDKLPGEVKLAESIGCSRSSIREALRILEAGGYVEIIPNRGAFAAENTEGESTTARSWLKINHEMVLELLDVRMGIEPLAARLSAENITEAGLAALAEIMAGFEETVAAHDLDRLARLELDFHRTILSESRNRYLIRIYRPLLEAFMQYSRRSLAITDNIVETLSEHRAIYNAIAARSPEEAQAAMLLHISIAKRRIGNTIR